MYDGLNYSYSYGAEDAFGSIIAAVGVFYLCILVFALVVVTFQVWLFYRIFQKAGYNGWMGLLMLIPTVGLIVCLCILAFDTWPIFKPVPPAIPAVPVAPAAPVVSTPVAQVYSNSVSVPEGVPAVAPDVPIIVEPGPAPEAAPVSEEVVQ